MRLRDITDPASQNPAEQAIIDRILKARGGKERLVHLDHALLHSPPFALGFLQLFGAVRFKSTLPADVMELAMCRVAALNSAAYEWYHHAPLLSKAGVSDRGIETVRTLLPGVTVDGEGGLDGRLWKVLRYTDAVTKDVKVPDPVFEALKEDLNERQIVELTLTICGYNAVSRFLVALDIAGLKDTEVGRAKL